MGRTDSKIRPPGPEKKSNFRCNITRPPCFKFHQPSYFFFWTQDFILIILVANWMELVPGVDSIGFWEHKPHFLAEKAAE